MVVCVHNSRAKEQRQEDPSHLLTNLASLVSSSPGSCPVSKKKMCGVEGQMTSYDLLPMYLPTHSHTYTNTYVHTHTFSHTDTYTPMYILTYAFTYAFLKIDL